MQTYSGILNRIIEIIKLSDNLKNELPVKEITKENFISIRHFDIYKDYVNEFNDLLVSERTYYLLDKNKNNDVTRKNVDLINLCKESIDYNPIYAQEYITLIEILTRSFNNTAADLVEYLGYYVLKSDYNTFIQICKKLRVGPNVILKAMDPKEVKSTIEESLQNNNEQYRRIKSHLENNLANVAFVSDMESQSETQIAVSEDKLEEVIDPNTQVANAQEYCDEYLDNKGQTKSLTCDFKEIVYLGMNGLLNTNMIIALSELLSEEAFDKLITILDKYNLFTKKELMRIKNRSEKNIRYIYNIDELVAYFAIRKGINVQALKLLIPSIGEMNYHYLIDQLFKFGAIDFDSYLSYLEENNFIETIDKPRNA